MVEAVSSALAQDGHAPRVVVVDDGSTDPDTRRVLDEELPDGAELVRTRNRGPSAARNTGAAHTETPLLLMLDADDRLVSGALLALRGPLEADPTLGFTYGLIEMFGDSAGPLTLPAYDPYRLLYRSLVPATSLLRREAFESAGGFDPVIGGYEDWDLYLGLLEADWRGLRVERPMLHYRRHGPSTLGTDRRGYRGTYRAIRRKHAALYDQADRLAQGTDLGLPGRVAYRSFWAWRPVPARLEAAVYAHLFR